MPSVMTRFQAQVARSKWCTSFRRRRSAPRPPNTTSRCATASYAAQCPSRAMGASPVVSCEMPVLLLAQSSNMCVKLGLQA